MTLRESLAELRELWPGMSLYERFEQIISLILVLAMALIVIIAVWQLLQDIVALVRETGLDPMDQRAFQQIFGAIMIVLIAMEFKYSIVRVVAREQVEAQPEGASDSTQSASPSAAKETSTSAKAMR